MVKQWHVRILFEDEYFVALILLSHLLDFAIGFSTIFGFFYDVLMF